MNLDGTNLTELVNYLPLQAPEGAEGMSYITGMFVDGEGNLWLTEMGNFYGYDLPDDFDPETDEMWLYYYDMGNVTAIRKLDETGAELLSVDISSLAEGIEYFYVSAFAVDSSGNAYIGAEQTIYVLDSNGRTQFKLEVTSWVERLIVMPDGSVAFTGFADGGRVVKSIDIAARSWGEEISLPFSANTVFPGGGDYSFIFSDGNNLFGIEESTGESIMLLNWIDSDMSLDGISNIIMLPDGRVLCTSYTWNNYDDRPLFELVILTKTPYEDLPERIVLTLATVWLDWSLRSNIVNFNKTNDTYRIRVIDYSEFRTEDDWMAGVTRLSTEIISGRVPDILDVSNLPYSQYVARNLLVDLNPYIDADPELNRDNLMDSVLRAAEINGGLYQIFPTFSISTLYGHPSVLGPNMGWNMSEFRDVLRANPQADFPLGQDFTKNAFLQFAISVGMDDFVDWSTGRCHFDTDSFIQLLEFANTFPEEFDWDYETYISPYELIAAGRQIILPWGISDFRDIQSGRAMFGGDVVFKGFPTESRTGNTLNLWSGNLSMTSKCSDKDGAWEFMRTIISEDSQGSRGWGFPVNKTAFNKRLEDAMTPQTYIDEYGNEVEMSQGGIGWGDGPMVELFALTQQDADLLMALIGSLSGTSSQNEALMNIINEGATDFFNGRNSAQDAARVIQSRATILIAELS
jgi:ABC-type glycerol-3-phosphate transport system substrate-binding protein